MLLGYVSTRLGNFFCLFFFPPGAVGGWFRRDYHMPCFGQRLNVSSWEWWFHVYTDTYLKTMLDYDMPEEVSGVLSV